MTKLFPFALAASIALAGCAGTPNGATFTGSGSANVKPGTTTPQTPGVAPKPTKPSTAVGAVPAAQAQAGAEISQETASALAEERDLADYDTLIDAEGAASTYQLTQFGATVTAMANGKLFGGVLRTSGKLNKADAQKLRAEAAKLKVKSEDFKAQRAEMKQAAAELKIDAAVKARVENRLVAHRAKISKRLDKMADARVKIRQQLADAPWVDNADGTQTKTLTFDITKTINGKALVRKATLVRTRNADHVIIASSGDFEQALPGGLKRVSSRTRTLQADGSYAVVFHALITLPGGATRTAHWEKSISADGVVTGTGVLTWMTKDGTVKKTVTIALGGTDTAPVASAEDTETNTTAEVTLDEAGAIAAVVETADGKTADVAVAVSTDGTVDVVTTEAGGVSVDTAGLVEVGAEADAAATTTAAL